MIAPAWDGRGEREARSDRRQEERRERTRRERRLNHVEKQEEGEARIEREE